MDNQSFTTSFIVDKTPEEAYNAINNVTGWWTENVAGDTQQLDDEFSVQFWDVHYSMQKLVEMIPGQKIVWLVTDSKLSFVNDQQEWTGTKIVFDIIPKNGQTEVRFTQIGLSPGIECYKDCSNAWNGYILNSLQSLIITGKGMPAAKEELAQ